VPAIAKAGRPAAAASAFWSFNAGQHSLVELVVTAAIGSQSQSLCVSVPTSRRPFPQHAFQIHSEISMSSLLEPGKEPVRHERAISSLRDRTDAPLEALRRVFAQEFSRLELGVKVRLYLWNERRRTLYRRVARNHPREFMNLLDSGIDSLVPTFTNSTRMLKEQLSAEGVSVWVSAGCLAEFARIASVAAMRTRQADEPYRSCLRREIATHSRFIREWTSSDKKFDQTQCGELVSIARKYALPRAWRLYEPVASVRGPAVAPRAPPEHA
jgi:hypothetical protein